MALDWRRSKKNQIGSSSQYENLEGTNRSPLTDLIRREQLDQVLNTIAALPSPAREIIVLRHLEHQSYETIATRLGKTKHQVRALSFKAIKKLRTSLAESNPPRITQSPATLPEH